MKKLFTSVIALLLLITLAIPVQAAPNGISVYYNDEKLDLDSPAFVEKGKTYVPIRSFFEQLEYEVSFNRSANQIVLDYYDYESIIHLDTHEVTEYDEVIIEDLSLVKRNNTFYAAVRELEPVTITTTKWDSATRSVYIEDDFSGVEEGEEEGEGAEEARVPSEGFLWKVSKGDNTVYMLGSIHVGTEALYPLRDEIYDAYDASEVVVTEVDIFAELTKEDEAELAKLIEYQDGTTLKDHLSESTYNSVIELAESIGVQGADLEQFKKYRVWYVNLIFSSVLVSGDAAGELGIEYHFLDLAEPEELPVDELESYMLQYNMLAGFSDELQEQLLLDSVTAVQYVMEGKELDNGIDVLLDLWIKGDLESFDAMAAAQKQAMPEYYDGLLTKRNVGMTDKIEQYLNSDKYNTYFVIAGALHFAGEDSILVMLKERGYTVERL